MHICGTHCHYKKKQKECKYGFSFNAYNQENSTFDSTSNRWVYQHLCHQDGNVVLYHTSLLLLWSAHMNLQPITSMYWSYHLLKYAMKCEPHGALQLNPKNTKILGLKGASIVQLQLNHH